MSSYVFVDKERAKEYECAICLGLLSIPYDSGCGNGHLFCKTCLNQHIEESENKLCPTCQSEMHVSKRMHMAFVERQISRLKVYCPNGYKPKILQYKNLSFLEQMRERERGRNKHKGYDTCKWIGELSNIKLHNKNCGYVRVKCKYCQATNIFRNDLEKHYKTCYRYLLKCQLGCGKEVERDKMIYHIQNICENRVIKCRYNCGDKGIKAKDWSIHENICPEKIVSCPLKKFGCDEKKKRCLMNKHINDLNSLNIHLLGAIEKITYIEKNIKDINEEQKKINVLLNTSNNERKQEIDQLQKKIDDLNEKL